MKKFLSLLLATITMAAVLTGCGTGGTPDVQPTPEPTPKVWYQNALTGEEQSIDYPLGYSPVAVMVNNIMSRDSYQSAWPQSGLSKADVVFEMETEGGITRYMALFRDWTKMPVVGPIRSARDQFVQIMMPFGCLYVHDGASIYAKNMLEMYDYYDKDLQPNKGIAFRDLTEYNKGLKAKEHTEFTSGQLVDEAINSGKYDLDLHGEPQQLFEWVKYDEPARVLEGVEVSEIEWRFSNSYAAKMTYNPETNKYTKEHINLAWNFSNPLIDAGNNGVPVEFDNVLVLWTQIERYPDGVLSDVSLAWGGVGYYFNGGKVEKVRWMKGQPYEKLRIVSLDGTETDVLINTGKSYVAFVDLDYFGAYMMDGVAVDSAGDYKPVEDMPVEEGVESTDDTTVE